MTTTTSHNGKDPAATVGKLPLAKLLALFVAGFLGILNETVPAGLLSEMSASIGKSESAVGQTITVYAVATALTAIPLNAAFRRVGRRTLLVGALLTFAAGNAVVAATDNFPVILVARFVSGVGAGLVWSNVGVFAARVAPERLQGKAISVAMAGIPAALSLGLPAGTVLGDAAGWHATFVVMAAVAALLVIWVLAALPNLPGAAGPTGDSEVSARSVLHRPGVRVILAVGAGYMVAHNLLYTYIGPLAARAGVTDLGWVLLTFGIAALLSIWATGSLVEPHHRRLIVLSTVVVGASALVLAFAYLDAVILYLGVAAWGFGFGGSATLFVTAGLRAARHDTFQAMLVTVFNLAIAAGGVFGGLLLSGVGVRAIPWVAFGLLVPTALTTVAGRRHSFPHWPRST